MMGLAMLGPFVLASGAIIQTFIPSREAAMGRMSHALTALVLLASLAAAAAAAPLQPLVHGWERYFTLDYGPDQRRGAPVVSGYLTNEWNMPATRVRLLVEGIGPNGEVLGQQLAWLGIGVVAPGSRVYFEVRPAQPAPAYRVSVFAFDWAKPPSG
jgi:hypothetical protein